jgi:hypothetical protein
VKNIPFVLISLLALISSFHLSGQNPQKIYGKNKVMKPNEYYLEQMGLWKLEVEKDPLNADAWYNFYRASRNAYIKGEEDNSQKSKGVSRFDRLKNIVDEMEKNVPDSYEYNYVKWLNGNNDLNLFPFLEKAHHLSPDSPEPIMSLIFYYEIQRDLDQRNKNIEAYYQLGDYSPGLLNYSYNLLAALEKDAIVLTEGDKDTEAILLLQKGKKYREDVLMLNVNLLLITEYRERIFKELEIEPLGFDPIENERNYERFQQTIITKISSNKKQKPVYTAITLSRPYTDLISPNLYLTGLAYQYSLRTVDHVSLLKKNVDQLFLLDYIQEYFASDISIGNVNSMNGNYLLPFTILSQVYLKEGNTTKANYYKDLALKVATASDRLEEFKIYFPEK